MRTLQVPFAQFTKSRQICASINEGVRPALSSRDPYFRLSQACTLFVNAHRPSVIDIGIALDQLAPSIAGVDIPTYGEYRDRITDFNLNPHSIGDVGTVENLIAAAEFSRRAMCQIAWPYFEGDGRGEGRGVGQELLRKISRAELLAGTTSRQRRRTRNLRTGV
jgi:hypothetical protein